MFTFINDETQQPINQLPLKITSSLSCKNLRVLPSLSRIGLVPFQLSSSIDPNESDAYNRMLYQFLFSYGWKIKSNRKRTIPLIVPEAIKSPGLILQPVTV